MMWRVVLVSLVVLGLGGVAVAAPIHEAIVAGNLDEVKAIVAKDPAVLKAADDSTSESYLKYLPLHLAVKQGNAEMVQFLLGQGADPKARTEDEGRTPLHVAAQGFQREIAELLLGKGAEVDAGDANGYTPAMLAVGWSAGNEEFVEFLLDKGSDPARTDTGFSPANLLHQASLMGFNLPVIKVLVEKRKMDVNGKGPKGKTPLVYAAQSGSLEIVRYLVEKGADPAALDDDGATLLMLAAPKGEPALVDFLLEKGGDVKASDRSGDTALHRAAYGSEEDKQVVIVGKLVAKGADPKAKNQAGKTARDLAAEGGRQKLAAALDQLTR